MAARAARDPTPRWALRNKPPHRPWPITTTSRAAWVVSEDSPNIPSQVRIDLGLLEIDPKIDKHKGFIGSSIANNPSVKSSTSKIE